MGIFDPKKRKIITAIIVLVIIIAMVVPMALSFIMV